MRATAALLLLLALASRGATAADWPQFGFDPQHSGNNLQETSIGPGNVASLHVLYSVSLPAIADGAPAFLAGVATPQGTRDLLFLTTKDGQLIALDAASGATVWSHRPASGPRYTTSSPAIDPNRQFVYAYGLEGRVHRYRSGDGTEIVGGGWPQVATLKPDVEKGSSALTVAITGAGTPFLYGANGGYPGDAGDYQGHLTAINLSNGLQQVFNANCSDRTVHFLENHAPDCPHVQSAVWARGGAVYDADLDRLFIATGNGDFDANHGGHDWGDSVLALHPDGSGNGLGPLDSYTPVEFQSLQDTDTDLGSTAPALLPAGGGTPHLALQSGKDGKLRLLALDDLSGQGGPAHLGGELQKLDLPQGGEVLTAPAVWADPADGTSWAFIANDSGIAGLQLSLAGAPALHPRWNARTGGSSPIVVNSILYYAAADGVHALAPTTGHELWHDGSPNGLHWESPIVAGGRLFVTDENARLWAYGVKEPNCSSSSTALCLNGNRFRVETTWTTAAGATGSGHAVSLTGDSGYFWFFSPTNVELVAKVLDACTFNQRFWVFAGGLTNVQVTLTVTDTATGAVQHYDNPLGVAFAPIQDTSAFASCP